jgi:hypothetical protein
VLDSDELPAAVLDSDELPAAAPPFTEVLPAAAPAPAPAPAVAKVPSGTVANSRALLPAEGAPPRVAEVTDVKWPPVPGVPPPALGMGPLRVESPLTCPPQPTSISSDHSNGLLVSEITRTIPFCRSFGATA